MPNENLDEAIREAYAHAPTDEVYLETIELSHPELEETFRFVKNRAAITAKIETDEMVEFEPVGFDFVLPESGQNGIQDLQLSIDNIDPEKRLKNFLSAAKGFKQPVEVTYRPYLASDLTQMRLNPPLVLFFSNATVTTMLVTGKASFADLLNLRFLTEMYHRGRFPSL